MLWEVYRIPRETGLLSFNFVLCLELFYEMYMYRGVPGVLTNESPGFYFSNFIFPILFFHSINFTVPGEQEHGHLHS